MTRRRVGALLVALVPGVAALLAAQESGLRQARAYYDGLILDSAVMVAERALAAPRITAGDRIGLYELLGYAYSAMDSSSKAVENFRALIFLAPDRVPDQRRVSPRIASQYQVALGGVLVAQRIGVDSASFVAGEGAVPIHFLVSRAASVRTRIAGPVDVVLDSQSTVGLVSVRWDGMGPAHTPVPPGRYLLIVELTSGATRTERADSLIVSHAPLDTLAHLVALAEYPEQAETEQPRRNWNPLSVAASYVSIGLAAALAFHNSSLGTGVPAGVVAVGAVSLGSGFALSLKRPEPRPVPAAVLYNHLVRDMLARRNDEIAAQNAVRRQKVIVTVVQAPRGPAP